MNVAGDPFFFVFLTLIVTLAVTSEPISNREPGHCSNPMPGSDKLMRGVDLKTLDIYDRKTFKRNVMKKTCFLKRTTKYNGEMYEVPDQIDSWTLDSEGSFTSTANVIESLEDLTKTFSLSVSVEASYKLVSGSASASYNTMKQDIAENKYFYTIVKSSQQTSTIFLHVPPHPRMEMTYTANRTLPWGIDYDARTKNKTMKYLQWIKRYGTHLVEDGHFGAVIRSQSKTDSSLKKKYRKEDLEAAAKVAYNGLVFSAAAEVSIGTSSNTMTSDFKKNSQTSIQYYGGETNLIKKGGLDEWSDTVRANPYLQTGKLMPIYFIIKDDHMREQMKMAVDDYLNSRDLESQFIDLESHYQSKFKCLESESQSNLKELREFESKVTRQISTLQKGINGVADSAMFVELYGGGDSYGAVYVWVHEKDGWLCDDLFGDNNNGAKVVCRMLGYSRGYYADGTQWRDRSDFLLDNVQCTGTETNLALCPHQRISTHNCGSSEVAGVRCYN